MCERELLGAIERRDEAVFREFVRLDGVVVLKAERFDEKFSRQVRGGVPVL